LRKLLQGFLSDGRSLLLAVAPAASAGMKAAAIVAMAGGVEAAMLIFGMLNTLQTSEDMFQWQAFHFMAYMVGRAHKAHFWQICMMNSIELRRTLCHICCFCCNRRHWRQCVGQHPWRI
jgi:hypothetical protein